jgi:hypothetical protein
MSTPTAALPVTEQPVTEQPATTPRTMQAVVFDDFGGPEVLVAREIPVPEVRPHDLLVRNASIGVNRADLLHRKGPTAVPTLAMPTLCGWRLRATRSPWGPRCRALPWATA